MARVSKADRLKKYQRQVERAVRWRTEEGYDRLWREMIEMYQGKMFADSLNDEDRIAINIAFSTINVIYPSVSLNYPKIGVSARDPQFDPHSAYGEVALNYFWQHYDYQDPFRLSVKDYLVIGHGWAKIGWSLVEEDADYDEDEIESEYQRQTEQMNSFAAENPELAAGLPTDEEIRASLASTKSVIVEDRPYLDRVSPFDVYVNPEATSMNDVKWIAQRVVRPLEEAKEDDRYKPSVRRRLKASGYWDGDWMTVEDRRKYADEIDCVIVWEHYDLASRKLCIWADGSDEYLVDPIEIPFAFGHPFVMIRNYDVPGSFYPIGELEMIAPMNDELNKTRSMLMNHRKRYARKYLVRERAFDERGRAGITSNEDGTVIPVIDENTPLTDLIVPVPQVPMGAELYNYSQQIMQDMQFVSGVSEYARGAMPSIRRTATEAAMIQDASNARAEEKRVTVERFITQISRKLMQLMQQFTTGDQVARINGRNGEVYWLEFTREDIQGEFDFIVEAGSTQPYSDTAKRQEAVAMAQVLMPFAQLGVIDPSVLARHLLQKFGVKNPETFMGAGLMQAPPMGGGPEGSEPGGEPGLNGEQLPPQVLLEAQQQGQLPPEIMAQLQNQVGLSL